MTKPVTSVMMPGGVDEFGLGFAMNTRALAKGRGAGTLSWSGVFDTFFWIDRENQTCAVLLTQVLRSSTTRRGCSWRSSRGPSTPGGTRRDSGDSRARLGLSIRQLISTAAEASSAGGRTALSPVLRAQAVGPQLGGPS
jgi:CubicO group peptidase (beta-lactamase class C family)